MSNPYVDRRDQRRTRSVVRSSSVKRVASAVGEGSVCVQLIHRALRER